MKKKVQGGAVGLANRDNSVLSIVDAIVASLKHPVFKNEGGKIKAESSLLQVLRAFGFIPFEVHVIKYTLTA